VVKSPAVKQSWRIVRRRNELDPLYIMSIHYTTGSGNYNIVVELVVTI